MFTEHLLLCARLGDKAKTCFLDLTGPWESRDWERRERNPVWEGPQWERRPDWGQRRETMDLCLGREETREVSIQAKLGKQMSLPALMV